MVDVERLDRPTQYRLLESVPDGLFWQPGALSLDCGSRFRLIEDVPPGHPQQQKPGWGRKAWNAAKYVGGLVTPHGQAQSSMDGVGKALGWNDKTPWIDKAQDVVSLVGVVDPTGIADVSNALVYGARGKFGDAAISLAGAAVPYAGDLAKLGKFGRATAHAAQTGKAAARTERVAATAAKIDANAVHAARQASKGDRGTRLLKAKAGRAMGRQGRTVAKAVTGTGKLRGQVGKLDTELSRRFGDRYAQGKQKLQAGVRDKAQGAFDAVKDAVSQKPEQPQPAPSPTIPPPEGRLARKTVHDEKPEAAKPPSQPTFTRKPPQAAAAAPKPTAAPAGGSAKTPLAKKPMAPVGGKCPTPDTKTSKFGAKDGFKRCHPQTPGREH
jgi:hypothetical protein